MWETFHFKSGKWFTWLELICVVILESGLGPVLQPIGFYPGDKKLSYKFKGDTISPRHLLGVMFIFPLMVIALGEWKLQRGLWFRESLRYYRLFLIGFLHVFTIIVILKVSVGEPRPHFFDTCRPREIFNSSETKRYIYLDECTNQDVTRLKVSDSVKSFPSGHAAFSVYQFIFLGYFWNKRHGRQSPFIWILVLPLVWAMVCSVTRVTDRRHHWWDVLGGIFIAAFTGIYHIMSNGGSISSAQRE